MKWKSVWRMSLLVSVLLNCGAIAVVGSRINHSNYSKRFVAKQDPLPTRLLEIRMLKSIPPKVHKARYSGSGVPPLLPPGTTKPYTPAGQVGSSTGTRAELNRMSTASGRSAGTSSLEKVHLNIHQRLTRNMRVELGAPKAGLVPAYSGILDLRHSKIKVVLHADPSLLPKGAQRPNKLIGPKPVIEYIGGKPKSTAKCVGAIGGRTVMGGGRLKIKGAENLQISGTKFCGPGAPGLPSSESSGRGGSSKQLTGAEFVSFATQAQLDRNYRDLASGPLKDGGALARTTPEGMEPGIQGEIRPTHLPEEDRPKTLPETPAKPAPVDEKAEKGLQPSLGSLSENGSIPWGPSRKKPKSGLLADFYLGRNFTRYLFTRRTRYVDFVWDGISADKELPPYNPYSVRWSGYIKPSTTDDYTIYTASDDGVRLWIDDKLMIDNWTCHA